MRNTSVFDFLKSDANFDGVYKKCIELEKGINNNLYDALRNTSRQICEKLLQIIIVDDKKDYEFADFCYKKEKNKKNPTLFEIMEDCKDYGYIKEPYLSKYHNIRKYGNGGSHYNEDELTLDEMKEIHRDTFDVILDCFSRFHDVDGIEYDFNLNSSFFTQVELDDILNNIPNEISTDLVANVINHKKILLPTSIFQNMDIPYRENIKKFNEYLDFIKDNVYITSSNLEQILETFDVDVRHELSNAVFNSHKILMDKLDKLGELVSLDNVRNLIDKHKDASYVDFYKLIYDIASDLIKTRFINILKSVNNLDNIKDEDDNVVDAPEYELVETQDSFEIREINKIIGIPEDCPKCGYKIKPGKIKCGNCGYDFFDELNKRCPKCGKRIPMGSKFCVECGKDLEKYKCGNCGYQNKKESKFCIKCGNNL